MLKRGVPDDFIACLPAGAVCAGGGLDEIFSPLLPGEEEAVRHAVAKRQREFRAGRHYARLALAALGFSAVPIPSGPGRGPQWPIGAVGSISHSDTYCLAAAAPSSALLGIGIDIEADGPVPEGTSTLICNPVELARSADQAKLLFVIKEAVYKLYHPLTGYFIDFHDVTVTLEGQENAFTAELVPRCPAVHGSRVCQGSYAVARGLIFACTSLPARPGC